jgi:hypothetical protein
MQATAPTTTTATETTTATAPAANIADALSQLFAAVVPGVEERVLKAIAPKLDEALSRSTVKREIIIKTPEFTTSNIDVYHKKFEMLCKVVAANLPVYLYGPAGTGKNHLIQQIADALKLDFYYSGAIFATHELTGYGDANGKFVPTEFFRAMKDGGLFFLDEFDATAPEVGVKLNAAIANGYFDFPVVGRVQAHPNFRVIAAGNTAGGGATAEYTGRNRLDAATLNRFVKVLINYDPQLEDVAGLGDAAAVEFIRELRDAAHRRQFAMVLSYRQITQLATLSAIGLTSRDAVQCSVIGDMQPDNIRMLANAVNLPGNKYADALDEISNNPEIY